MDQQRLAIEMAVLNKYLTPNLFKFQELGTPNEHIVMAARTNRKNIYRLYIKLADFPLQKPEVYVAQTLKDKWGHVLPEFSGKMHTLGTWQEKGWTQICHYGAWNPDVAIYKIYIKCRLWLEMYELHLQTGKPIDYYLNHQQM
jgi:hypothetical protein